MVATAKHINLRLSPELHSFVVAEAAREHRSVNGQIEWYIEQQRQHVRAARQVANHRDSDPGNNDPGNLEIGDPPSKRNTQGGFQPLSRERSS